MVLNTEKDLAAAEPTGLWSWITTVDHKRIGLMYGASALLFFFVAGLEALLLRLQLAPPPFAPWTSRRRWRQRKRR